MSAVVGIAVLVKTPGLSPIKTRLADKIGVDEAENFHRLCCKAMESVLEECHSAEERLYPYWAIAEEQSREHSLWKNLSAFTQGEGDLGDRIAHVYAHLRENHAAGMLLGADTPHLSSALICDAARKLMSPKPTLVIGPSEDGGFYLLGANFAIAPEIWKSVNFGQKGSPENLEKALTGKCQVERLASDFDVDVLPDLLRLAKVPGTAFTPQQAAVIEWAKKFS